MNKEPIKKVKYFSLFLPGSLVFLFGNVLFAWKTLFSVNLLVTKSYDMYLCKNTFTPTFFQKYVLTDYKILAWNLFSFNTLKPHAHWVTCIVPFRGQLLIEVLLLQKHFFHCVLARYLTFYIFIVIPQMWIIIIIIPQVCWKDMFHQFWEIFIHNTF